MAETLTSKELAEIKRLFSELDINMDGNLTREEIEKVLVASNQARPEEQVDHLMMKLDKDKNGVVTFSEFLEFYVTNWLNKKDIMKCEL